MVFAERQEAVKLYYKVNIDVELYFENTAKITFSIAHFPFAEPFNVENDLSLFRKQIPI